MILQKFYELVKFNRVVQSIVGMLLAFIILGVLYTVGNGVYVAIVNNHYENAKPKEFLNFYNVKVTNVPVGQPPQLMLCRKIYNGNVKIDAVRTFIQFIDSGKQKEVAERIGSGYTTLKDWMRGEVPWSYASQYTLECLAVVHL